MIGKCDDNILEILVSEKFGRTSWTNYEDNDKAEKKPRVER